MTIARRSHGGQARPTPNTLKAKASVQPPPAILPVPRTRHAPQPVTSLRGSGTSQPAQSAVLSKTEDNSLSAPLPAARTSPVAKTPRGRGSRDGDGTRTPGLRARPYHSVAPSARSACHPVALSGTTSPGNCAYADSRAIRWHRVRDARATRWR